jgi:hypothetical protein
LFTRGLSGARVVKNNSTEKVAGIEFVGYGSSSSVYPCAYFSVACAIGVSPADIVVLEERLDATFVDWRKRSERATIAALPISNLPSPAEGSHEPSRKALGADDDEEEE